VTRERELVELFADRSRELDALRLLCGGITATDLRTLRVSALAFEAVVEGLAHQSSRVRWWCVQILDHVPDPRAICALARALDDPVPRVRRNAAHAFGCVACKPDWSGDLPGDILQRLCLMATNDPSAKVRAQASWALGCRSN
jgi:HEAT repeat protein